MWSAVSVSVVCSFVVITGVNDARAQPAPSNRGAGRSDINAFICRDRSGRNPNGKQVTVDATNMTFRMEETTSETHTKCITVLKDGAHGSAHVGPTAGYCNMAGLANVHQQVRITGDMAVAKASDESGGRVTFTLDLNKGILRDLKRRYRRMPSSSSSIAHHAGIKSPGPQGHARRT